jgi:hypothetical protein
MSDAAGGYPRRAYAWTVVGLAFTVALSYALAGAALILGLKTAEPR